MLEILASGDRNSKAYAFKSHVCFLLKEAGTGREVVIEIADDKDDLSLDVNWRPTGVILTNDVSSRAIFTCKGAVYRVRVDSLAPADHDCVVAVDILNEPGELAQAGLG